LLSVGFAPTKARLVDDSRVVGKVATSQFQDDEVKWLSPNHRLVIALHSPDGMIETGLRDCPPERNPPKLACQGWRGRLSPVRFRVENRRNAAFSRNFQGNKVGILCVPDWLAEGETFEPAVQLVEP
jgi:hypothetical protein